jgi:hypothetical protein
MIQIEKALINRLTKEHQVDGHDAGSGEMNIFIFTKNPKGAFSEVATILGSRDFWVDARVAYREVKKDEYTILWPEGLSHFEIM